MKPEAPNDRQCLFMRVSRVAVSCGTKLLGAPQLLAWSSPCIYESPAGERTHKLLLITTLTRDSAARQADPKHEEAFSRAMVATDDMFGKCTKSYVREYWIFCIHDFCHEKPIGDVRCVLQIPEQPFSTLQQGIIKPVVANEWPLSAQNVVL